MDQDGQRGTRMVQPSATKKVDKEMVKERWRRRQMR